MMGLIYAPQKNKAGNSLGGKRGSWEGVLFCPGPLKNSHVKQFKKLNSAEGGEQFHHLIPFVLCYYYSILHP